MALPVLSRHAVWEHVKKNAVPGAPEAVAGVFGAIIQTVIPLLAGQPGQSIIKPVVAGLIAAGAVWILQLLRHWWEAPLYVAQKEYKLLEGMYEGAVTARDAAHVKLKSHDTERRRTYEMLNDLVAAGASLGVTRVATEDDWTQWRGRYEAFRVAVAAIAPRLEPHERNRVRVVKYDTKRYTDQFNQEHGNCWNALHAFLNELRNLADAYSR